MKPRALCNKINEFLEKGLEQGVFLAIQPHLLRGLAGSEALEPPVNIGMLTAGGVSVSEYVELLDADRYSAVFHDHALLMLQCNFAGNEIRNHRYGYIPCPIRPDLMVDRPEDIPVADWVRSVVSSTGVDSFLSLGTYRFDFTKSPPTRSTEPHPVSHLTFASAGCRLPVRSPMTISHMLSFLFDNFYRQYRTFWNDFAPHLNGGVLGDTITESEQMLHHLTWADEPY
ncbi:DUF2290 domain-containing protein [Bradyrhizobium sp. 18BD]